MRTWRFTLPAIILLVGMILPSASAQAAPVLLQAPLPPTDVAAVPGNYSATVSWKTPIFIQTYRVAGYQIAVYRNGLLTYPAVPVPAGTTSYTIGPMTRTPLTNNVPYTFTVRMKLSTLDQPPIETEWSAPSTPSNVVVPGIVPGAPTTVDVHAGVSNAIVTWSAPTIVGTSGVGAYRINVYQQDGNGVYQPVAAPAISYTLGPSGTIGEVSGLSTSRLYRFTVQASNLTGWGTESAPTASITPNTYHAFTPTIDAVTSGDGSLTLHWPALYSWQANHYLVQVYQDGGGLVAYQDAIAAAPVTISGLTNGVSYIAQVRAISAAHMMSQPAWVRATPGALAPLAPTNLRVALNDRGAALYWTAPSAGTTAAVDHYAVQVSLGNVVVWSNEVVRSTSVGVTGLTPGYLYVVEVRSVSAAGAKSVPVTVGFTAGTLPSAPANVHASLIGTQVTVTWTAPTYDGSIPITGYVVTASTGQPKESSQVMTGPWTTSATFSNLIPGRTYSFVVGATNSIGTGPTSIPSNPVVLATVPGMVRNLTATDADEAATVRWDVPTSDGYSPITAYQVTASDGVHAPLVTTVTGTSVTISPLINGTTYTVSVVAINAVGQSQAATALVIPRNLQPALTVPGAQTVQYSDRLALTVTATDRDVRDHITLTATGLPEGLSFTDKGNGTGTVLGAVQAPAGTYTILFTANDGHNAAVTGATTITVAAENAVLVPAGTSGSLVVKKPTDKTSVTVKVRISEASDGNPGLITRAAPLTITLTPLGSSTTYTRKVSIGSLSNGTLALSATFKNLPTNVYRVTLSVGGAYYTGTGHSVFTVYSPTVKGSISAGGTVVSQTAPGSFSVYGSFGKNGKATGKFVYTGQHPEGNFTLSGKIVGLIIKNHRAYIEGQGSMNGVSGFRFTVSLADKRHLGQAGQVSLWTVDPQHALVGHCSFALSDVAGGTVKVSAT